METPLFEMCCLHMGTARKGGGGGVKACQDGLGTFFPSARGCKGLPGWFGALFLTEGESKAIWAMLKL